DEFRIVIELLKTSSENSRLIVMLETNGGYIETVERLVVVMRRHYSEVFFIIPNYAYSAGTVLALSGDRIYMDYYSVLGPIDPQFPGDDGSGAVPGAGYLAKFEELTEVINKAKDPGKVRAELSYLIKRFDPAKLFHIEQSIEHGQSLIMEWLPKYKLKDWVTTQSTGKPVTDSMRKKRAKEIAGKLGDAKKWHSHGRGISMQRLRSEDIKLQIEDFGAEAETSQAIRNYHGLCVDHAGRNGLNAFIHASNGLRSIST
ncbi:MAG: serine dehydrogenasease, partial [Pseudomonadota bacterium]